METLQILTIIMIILINLMITVTLHVYTVASIQKDIRDFFKEMKDERNENNRVTTRK